MRPTIADRVALILVTAVCAASTKPAAGQTMRRLLLHSTALHLLAAAPLAAQGAPERVTFKAVAASLNAHTCALSTSGHAYCWGLNAAAQLGTTTDVGRCKAQRSDVPCATQPVPVGGAHTFAALTVGAWHTCALTPAGQAYCWGDDEAGNLGSDSANVTCPAGSLPVCQPRPVPVAGDLRFTTIAAGGFHTCALSTEGRAYCWGANNTGQLGSLGAGESCEWHSGQQVQLVPCSTRPTEVAGALRFTALTAGRLHTCALGADSLLYCWGGNESGELGRVTKTAATTPQPISDTLKFTAVAAGSGKTCAIAGSGSTFCWGGFTVGPDMRYVSAQPEPLGGDPRPFTILSVGGEHACGITPDRVVFCWGDGRDGQLGIGGFGIAGVIRIGKQGSNEPARIAGDRAYTAVSAGGTHTCAVAVDGTLYCWGSGPYGELGIGNTQKKGKPEPIRAPLRRSPSSP